MAHNAMVVKAPVTCADLSARIVALEANLTALRQVLDERDARYTQRAASQDAAVKNALETSEKAIFKAETATERRFEGVNEFRQTLADQAATLMPRAEYSVQHGAVVDRVGIFEDRLNQMQKEVSNIQAGSMAITTTKQQSQQTIYVIAAIVFGLLSFIGSAIVGVFSISHVFK